MHSLHLETLHAPSDKSEPTPSYKAGYRPGPNGE